MGMSDRTKATYETLKAQFGKNLFSRKDFKKYAQVVPSTMMRHNLMAEVYKTEVVEEMTIEDFIEMVNDWVGEDLYGMSIVHYERRGEKVVGIEKVFKGYQLI